MTFDKSVFINCPLDSEFAPLLEAMLFCVVSFGLTPRLATERIESGESRFDKILELVRACKYSIHDLSRCRAVEAGDYCRMNMPFELGVDMGFRRTQGTGLHSKRFIIFESDPYDLKRALSDLAGADVEFHRNNHQQVIKKLRHFFRSEAKIDLPGPTLIETDYYTFQGWMMEKKIREGHSEAEAKELPTAERLDEMIEWVRTGRPLEFS